MLAVARRLRVAVDLQASVIEIEQPGLWYAMGGVERDFDIAVMTFMFRCGADTMAGRKYSLGVYIRVRGLV